MFPQLSAISERQQASMRANTQFALAGEPVYQNLSAIANENLKGDHISPQLFLTRPDITDQIAAQQILDEWPVLPGRPYGVPDYGETGAPIGGTY